MSQNPLSAFGDPFPSIGLPYPALLSENMPNLIVTWCTLFSQFFWETSSFPKGNDEGVDLGGLRKWLVGTGRFVGRGNWDWDERQKINHEDGKEIKQITSVTIEMWSLQQVICIWEISLKAEFYQCQDIFPSLDWFSSRQNKMLEFRNSNNVEDKRFRQFA